MKQISDTKKAPLGAIFIYLNWRNGRDSNPRPPA